MITRIVKLTFRPEEVSAFHNIFEESKNAIKAMEGCLFLSLHQQSGTNNVYFTISQWHEEKHLEAYRNSELFQATWTKTKALFEARPEAWTLINHYNSGQWQAPS